MKEKCIAIYHRVMRREDFAKAAKDLISLVRTAEMQNPGKPRILYLDIDGHRNKQGGFDADMTELQTEFGLGFLSQFLTEAHFPLASVQNTKEQRNDVPDKLEIFNAGNEQDHSLEDLYLENFEYTEYQSEETVYAYLKKVSSFLKSYQDLDVEYASMCPEPYDPHCYLIRWRLYMRELINELFNMFLGGNLFSAAAMTRTLMECYAYVAVLKQEKSPHLIEDWYLCGLIQSLSDRNGEMKPGGLELVQELCGKWGREPEEMIRRFTKGSKNKWLSTVIPDGRISFWRICKYLQEEELYQDYQWACAFVHGQDIYSKEIPFTFYDAIYHQLTIIMSYIFKVIRLYPVTEKLEEDIKELEDDLIALWGTTSWDKGV